MPQPDNSDQSRTRQDAIHTRVAIHSSRGARLYLHRVVADKAADVSGKAPVLLAHGTFSNHRTCGGLARYLASMGYDCWLIDYEGHGISDAVHPPATFESMFLSGTEAAIDYLTTQTQEKIHWVGHSGGGLAALMTVARLPAYTSKLLSLVMLGSQANDAGITALNRTALHFSRVLTKLLPVVPGKKLGLGPEDESATVMLQWYQWNLQAKWLGVDGFDYEKALACHKQLAVLPILGMAGSGDRFIAPPAACEKLFARLPATHKRWFECGVENDFSEDYSHARLISSRAAAKEIWPRIAQG